MPNRKKSAKEELIEFICEHHPRLMAQPVSFDEICLVLIVAQHGMIQSFIETYKIPISDMFAEGCEILMRKN